MERKSANEASKEKRIADASVRTRQQITKSRLSAAEMLLDWFVPNGAAKVKRVSSGDDAITITVRWPFQLRQPTGDPNDYLGTAKSQKEFRNRFERHLSEDQAGRNLERALYITLIEFTLRFLRVHRSADQRSLRALIAPIAKRRLAGRPAVETIEKDEANQIRLQGREIHDVVAEIRSLVNRLKLRGSALRKKISRDYTNETYPWMRWFWPALQELHGKPAIDQTNRWSAASLTRMIVRKERYWETCRLHYLVAIKEILKFRGHIKPRFRQ